MSAVSSLSELILSIHSWHALMAFNDKCFQYRQPVPFVSHLFHPQRTPVHYVLELAFVPPRAAATTPASVYSKRLFISGSLCSGQTPQDYWGKNSGEEQVRIYGNDLVHGVVDKAQFGGFGLVHAVQVTKHCRPPNSYMLLPSLNLSLVRM